MRRLAFWLHLLAEVIDPDDPARWRRWDDAERKRLDH
jgi:hypothetical protein